MIGEDMGIVPISSDNDSFSIDLKHVNCSEKQYLRELVMNCIDAKRPDSDLEVLIDVDWNYYEKNGVYKMCISDNGKGMSGSDIRKYLNKTNSSSNTQSLLGNFGIGAKVSAYPINKEGVVYKSWIDNKGKLGVIKCENGQYGLYKFEDGPVTKEIIDIPEEDWKPANIKDFGTSVTLCGNSEDENTLLPEGETTTLWTLKYLNRKFLTIPDNVEIKVRYFVNKDDKTWPKAEPSLKNKDARWSTINGSRYWLDKNSSKGKGIVNLSNGKIHWWIIDKEVADRAKGTPYIQKAHTAVLHKNELYDYQDNPVVHRNIAIKLGIYAGNNKVVMYFEPDPNKFEKFVIDPSRSGIKIDDQSPWNFCVDEFKKKMPKQIAKLIEEEARKGKKELNLNSLSKAFKKFSELYQGMGFRRTTLGLFSKKKASKNGDSEKVEFKTTGKQKVTKNNNKNSDNKSKASKYLKSDKGIAESTTSTTIRQPDILWYTADQLDEDLRDTVGYYNKVNNQLNINKDFSMFKELYSYFAERNDPDKYKRICDIIDTCIAAKLIDAIISARSFENSFDWSETRMESILTPESLSFIVMQKLFLLNEIESKIIVNLGKSK